MAKHGPWATMIQAIWKYVSHFIAGLAVGVWLSSMYLLVLIAPLKTADDTSERLKIAFWWVFLMPLVGLAWAKSHPLTSLKKWSSILWLAPLVLVGVFLCGTWVARDIGPFYDENGQIFD